jgi:hypothetical protein
MKGQFIFRKFGRSVGGWLRGTVWGLELRGHEKGKYLVKYQLLSRTQWYCHHYTKDDYGVRGSWVMVDK